MRAVRLFKGVVQVGEQRLPRRRKGFALIRLRAAGICNTDIELQRGYYGFAGTPGHEFVGDVVEADDPALAGARVAGEINLACRVCEWCRNGLERHCPNRTVLGIVRHPGAFAEYLTLPERNLHVLPPSLPDESAVFIEPLAAACEILDQVRMPKGATVAVLGDGKLGLLIGQVLQAGGLTVHQYGRHKDKLRLAAGFGIETRLAGRHLPKRAYSYTVDATGSPGGLRTAIELTQPRGVLVLKSTLHGMVEINTARIIVDELTLVGSRCGRFAPAIRLLRSGRVRVEELIADRFPLSRAREAFRRAAEPGVLKVLLFPD